MVVLAARRGQYIPWGASIRFPSSCLSEELCSWLFFFAEMFCLSGCLMNCFDSSNCLPVLIGSAVWCGILSEHQDHVKSSSRTFLTKGRGIP